VRGEKSSWSEYGGVWGRVASRVVSRGLRRWRDWRYGDGDGDVEGDGEGECENAEWGCLQWLRSVYSTWKCFRSRVMTDVAGVAVVWQSAAVEE
jgi:hypothetical protein